jgi:opacity protein-like surface antigen
MNTYTLGVGLTWKIKDRVSLDAAYKRYIQQGLDGVTSGQAYADANVWTLGLRVWF